MEGLLYPDLSYKITGLCFELYNKLKFGYQEKYYQRAFSLLLLREKIKFQKEVHHVVRFENTIIGRYFIDFVVEDKIVVEFKVADQIYDVHVNQVLAYLRAANFRLGILVLISQSGIKTKRLVN